MARPTIETVRNIGDVASGYRWDLTFLSVPTALASFSSEDLNARCESTTLPKKTMAMSEINIRGHKIKYPGRLSYNGEIDMTFIETENNLLSSFMKTWMELCWDPKTGIMLPKSELEARVLIKRLNHQNIAIWQYQIHGTLPIEPDFGTLDGGETEVIKPKIKLGFDYFLEKAL